MDPDPANCINIFIANLCVGRLMMTVCTEHKVPVRT